MNNLSKTQEKVLRELRDGKKFLPNERGNMSIGDISVSRPTIRRLQNLDYISNILDITHKGIYAIGKMPSHIIELEIDDDVYKFLKQSLHISMMCGGNGHPSEELAMTIVQAINKENDTLHISKKDKKAIAE